METRAETGNRVHRGFPRSRSPAVRVPAFPPSRRPAFPLSRRPALRFSARPLSTFPMARCLRPQCPTLQPFAIPLSALPRSAFWLVSLQLSVSPLSSLSALPAVRGPAFRVITLPRSRWPAAHAPAFRAPALPRSAFALRTYPALRAPAFQLSAVRCPLARPTNPPTHTHPHNPPTHLRT